MEENPVNHTSQLESQVDVVINDITADTTDIMNDLALPKSNELEVKRITFATDPNIDKNVTQNQMGTEILGSVKTFSPKCGPESGQAVRTSARVIQKLKLDSIRPPTPPPILKDHLKEEKLGAKTPNQMKSSRTNGWNNIEKNLFFEALNDYGKDFDMITHYINTKLKRKNPLEVTFKTRDQTRLFYHQSFQRVSKYLKFSDEIKKIVQELYALINYGEMRKKIMFVNEKCLMKLRELVYQGCVTIRTKGKNIKLKTPSCKALRQLNLLENGQQNEIKLPQRIEILLKPANLHSWGKVQSIAQNPRVKMTLPIQRKVSCIIKTLQHKWRHQDFRLLDKTIMAQTNVNFNSPKSVKLKHELENNPPQMSTTEEPTIRLLPSPDDVIHRPMIKITETVTSQQISLNAYEDRVGVKIKGEILCSERISNLKEMIKSNSRRQRNDSTSDKKSPESKKSKFEFDIRSLEPCDKLETIISNSILESPKLLLPQSASDDPLDGVTLNKIFTDSGEKIDPPINNSNECLDGINNTNNNQLNMAPTNNELPINGSLKNGGTKKRIKNHTTRKKYRKRDAGAYRPLIQDQTINQIRHGWTLTNIGDMTVGDLYVMFGSQLKLNLNYLFIESIIKTENTITKSEIPTTISNSAPFANVLGSLQLKANTEKLKTDVKMENCLGAKLKQLLSIANMVDQKRKKSTSCFCGHTCETLKAGRVKKLDASNVSFISDKTHSANQNDNVIFRSPSVPLRTNLPIIDPYRQQSNYLQRIRHPRWIKSRNRQAFPSKQVVVQRILPLQPAPTNLIKDSILLPNIEIKLNIQEIHDTGQTYSPEKITITDSPAKTSAVPVDESTIIIEEDEIEDEICDTIEEEEKVEKPEAYTEIKEPEADKGLCEEEIHKPGLNMPSIDESQSNFPEVINENTGLKNLMDISLPSAMDFEYEEAYIHSTPLISPMKILKEISTETNDSAWLTPDINDFSFSSFLGHLDNLAENDRKNNIHENAADASNLSVISDSSVDYMTKFAQITAELKEQEDEDMRRDTH